MRGSQTRKSSGSWMDADQSFYNDLKDEESYSEIIEIQSIHKNYEKLQMLPAEKVINEQTIVIKDATTKLDTQLCLTNYRIVIMSENPVSIPYGYIQQVVNFSLHLEIKLKTGISFYIHPQRNIKRLKKLIDDGMSHLPFCMYQVANEQASNSHIQDSDAEAERMGVDDKLYKVFKNTDFKFCPTYPFYFLIPKNVEINNLQEIRKCRYLGRLPVMSYYHYKTEVGIWRSSKLLPNLAKETKKYDLAYQQQISKQLIVIEIESSSMTKNDLTFDPLPSVQQNFQNLTSEYRDTHANLPSSRMESLLKALGIWYKEIDKLLSASYYVASLITNRKQVLLEETHSVDRVPQIMCLSSIILDSFYRTFQGFGVLIEKQFVNFGHPFEVRCGFTKGNSQELSPIFIQFLECVHQLIVAHPSAFQYSSTYLAKIAYQIFTTKYRNFMDRTGNASRTYTQAKCQSSIWNQMKRERCHYNFQFCPTFKKELWELRPKPSVKEYLTWAAYFDMVTCMNGEKKIDGQPIPESSRLSKFFSQGVHQ